MAGPLCVRILVNVTPGIGLGSVLRGTLLVVRNCVSSEMSSIRLLVAVDVLSSIGGPLTGNLVIITRQA